MKRCIAPTPPAGDIPTAFSSLPYEHADAYALSEFYGTARQSRVALMAEGKTGSGTLRGYYEADWLGTGVTSNNNESNSYVFRERVLWAQAALQQRVGLHRWPALVPGDGRQEGPFQPLRRHSHSLDHRSELRSGLRLGPPVRLPGYQDHADTMAFGIGSRESPVALLAPRWPATLPTPSLAARARTVETTTPPSAPARPRPAS